MKHVIEITDLQKSYGEVHAVKGISFYVEEGKLFAFLGPNGAGKSTTIDIITTFLKPDSGRCLVDGYELGKDDNAIRKSIGTVFQDGLLDTRLTVAENLRYRGGLYGMKGAKLEKTVRSAMQIAGIEDLAERQYGQLSGGQKRRCDIARALVHTPKILFLDEPTTGLDPQTRMNVWETIKRLQELTGMTVFLTTHYMEEAADADYVIVIDQGEIAAKGTPTDLREQYATDKLFLVPKAEKKEELATVLERLSVTYTEQANRFLVNIDKTMSALPIIKQVESLLEAFEVSAGTMDDAFIAITGKEIRNA